MLKNLNENEFKEFIKSEEKVIVKFFADWCGPCKAMMPALLNAETKHPGKIAKLNIDDYSSIAEKYGVTSIPALMVFEKGELVDKKIGMSSTKEISTLINYN